MKTQKVLFLQKIILLFLLVWTVYALSPNENQTERKMMETALNSLTKSNQVILQLLNNLTEGSETAVLLRPNDLPFVDEMNRIKEATTEAIQTTNTWKETEYSQKIKPFVENWVVTQMDSIARLTEEIKIITEREIEELTKNTEQVFNECLLKNHKETVENQFLISNIGMINFLASKIGGVILCCGHEIPMLAHLKSIPLGETIE